MMKALIKAGVVGLFMAMCSVSSISIESSWALEDIDAYQVAVNEYEREDGDDQTTDMEMVLVSRSGQERIRKIAVFRKDYGKDGKDDKRVMFFLEPADVKNTAFLIIEAEAVPAVAKQRRVSQQVPWQSSFSRIVELK